MSFTSNTQKMNSTNRGMSPPKSVHSWASLELIHEHTCPHQCSSRRMFDKTMGKRRRGNRPSRRWNRNETSPGMGLRMAQPRRTRRKASQATPPPAAAPSAPACPPPPDPAPRHPPHRSQPTQIRSGATRQQRIGTWRGARRRVPGWRAASRRSRRGRRGSRRGAPRGAAVAFASDPRRRHLHRRPWWRRLPSFRALTETRTIRRREERLLASRHGRRRVFSEWISEWNEFICVSSLVRCPSTDGWDRILDRRARCATSRAGKEHAVSYGGPRHNRRREGHTMTQVYNCCCVSYLLHSWVE